MCGVSAVEVEWNKGAGGRWEMKEVEGTQKIYKADLILLAMGFLGPEKYVANELGTIIIRLYQLNNYDKSDIKYSLQNCLSMPEATLKH